MYDWLDEKLIDSEYYCNFGIVLKVETLGMIQA